MKLNEQELYDICKENNESYDGIFWLGVLTTKIYCLPSCRAKMPLKKNVKYFVNRQDAIEFGLRGCKRCRSEFYPNTQPDWLNGIIISFESNKDRKFKEEELENISSVNYSTINRYFKNYLKTTPMAFHRKIRLNHGKKLIINGTTLLDIPYLTGFSSLSGFRSAFLKEFGINPGGFTK